MFSDRLNDYIKKLAEGEFYDIGGGEQPIHQYGNAMDMKLSTALAKNCTVVDCLDEEEVQTVMPFDQFKFSASSYVTADMDKHIDIEPKPMVIVKDALCWFDHAQGYENVLRMVQDNGMIIVVDNAYVIKEFREYAKNRMFTFDEWHYPFCQGCGEDGPSNCKEAGLCDDGFNPYAFAVFIKSDKKIPYRSVKPLTGERLMARAELLVQRSIDKLTEFQQEVIFWPSFESVECYPTYYGLTTEECPPQTHFLDRNEEVRKAIADKGYWHFIEYRVKEYENDPSMLGEITDMLVHKEEWLNRFMTCLFWVGRVNPNGEVK